MNNLIIETSNLCKCYGVNMVVSHVNIHVQKGSIYGLLGRNGAGKTSIMKMMLVLPFCLSLIGGYIIDREYTQNTQKNLFTIPVRWSRVIKAKVLVAFSLSIWIGLFSNIVLILTGMVMNCSQIAITDIWKIVISNFISPVCVLVGTLPIILWFSKAKGKYLWGATLSLLLGVSGVFVANGRAVNWHPITYCFSFIQCDSIYTTVLKIPFSCLAIVLYLLLSVIIYVFMYRKQEYPVS